MRADDLPDDQLWWQLSAQSTAMRMQVSYLNQFDLGQERHDQLVNRAMSRFESRKVR